MSLKSKFYRQDFNLFEKVWLGQCSDKSAWQGPLVHVAVIDLIYSVRKDLTMFGNKKNKQQKQKLVY